MKNTIQVCVYPSYWKNPPSLKVLLNGHILLESVIEQNSTLTVSYDKSILKEKNILELERYGKTIEDTVLDAENNVVQDQYLSISDLIINQIELGNIIYRGRFFPEYPEPWATQQKENDVTLPEYFSPSTDFNHNGVWKLEWEEPFHIWYLENLWD